MYINLSGFCKKKKVKITLPNTEVISRWTLELTPPILYSPIVLMPKGKIQLLFYIPDSIYSNTIYSHIFVQTHTTIQKFEVSKIFWKKSLMLNKAAFIWLKYSKNINIVKN